VIFRTWLFSDVKVTNNSSLHSLQTYKSFSTSWTSVSLGRSAECIAFKCSLTCRLDFQPLLSFLSSRLRLRLRGLEVSLGGRDTVAVMENLAITLGRPCSSKNIHTLVGGGGGLENVLFGFSIVFRIL
jgi:hypothetical protein